MAKPTTVKSGKMNILMGDGATPEVFTAPCGLNTKGFTQSKNMEEIVVGDCDDPDAAAYVERGVISISAQATGEGVLALEALPVWRAAFLSTDPVNCRIFIDDDEGGYYEGAFHLSEFEIGATRGQKVDVRVTLVSDGEYTWTDAI